MSNYSDTNTVDSVEIRKNMIEAIGCSGQLVYMLELAEMYDEAELVCGMIKNCYSVLGSVINIEELKELDNYREVAVNISDILEDIVLQIRSRLRLGKVEITLECEPDIYALTDPNRFISCIMNLIVNSIQNVDASDGVVCLRVIKLSESVSISISDNGLGMNRQSFEDLLKSETHTGGIAVISKFCEKAGTKLITDVNEYSGFMASFRLPLAQNDTLKLNSTSPHTASSGSFSIISAYISKIKGLSNSAFR